MTSIIDAARGGDLARVQELLSNVDDIDIHAANWYGRTALHLASLYGHVDIVKALLKAGANVNAEDNEGRTPLHSASASGKVDVVRELVSAGANVSAEDKRKRVNADDEHLETPLHKAASGGNDEVVKELLSKGAHANAANDRGDTPLHQAALQGYSKVVVELLSSDSVIVNAQNESGLTPLDLARNGGKGKVVPLLSPESVGYEARDMTIGVNEVKSRKFRIPRNPPRPKCIIKNTTSQKLFGYEADDMTIEVTEKRGFFPRNHPPPKCIIKCIIKNKTSQQFSWIKINKATYETTTKFVIDRMRGCDVGGGATVGPVATFSANVTGSKQTKEDVTQVKNSIQRVAIDTGTLGPEETQEVSDEIMHHWILYTVYKQGDGNSAVRIWVERDLDRAKTSFEVVKSSNTDGLHGTTIVSKSGSVAHTVLYSIFGLNDTKLKPLLVQE